jgi:hypothetical protein
MALLQSLKDTGGVSKQAVVSLMISAATTGFASASISYDWDVGPKRRHDVPEVRKVLAQSHEIQLDTNSRAQFYGYIPDSKSQRTLCFLLMISNGALLLLLRSLSIALLLTMGVEWLVLYYIGDWGLYLLAKLARGDVRSDHT